MFFTLTDVRAQLVKRAMDPPPGATLPGNPFRTGGTPNTQFSPDTPKFPKAQPADSGLLDPNKAPAQPGIVGQANRLSAQYFPGLHRAFNPTQADMLSKATENTPPVALFGDYPLSGTVNSVMGAAQSAFKDNPAGFAGLVGGLGKPLVEPLMSTPFGLPVMSGLYGATVGGPSFGAAYTYFKPVLDKLNL